MKVGVLMGSKSDWTAVQNTVKILQKFGVEVECRVISAHRTPKAAEDFAKNAMERGFEVIIAAAGKAAHLAGVIAAMTTLPVIGIPMTTSDMGGMDSLLSTVQMPKGVPVATVAIGGVENAGILAVQMLSIKYDILKERLKEFKREQELMITQDDESLEY